MHVHDAHLLDTQRESTRLALRDELHETFAAGAAEDFIAIRV
jgi:hypothetical protein